MNNEIKQSASCKLINPESCNENLVQMVKDLSLKHRDYTIVQLNDTVAESQGVNSGLVASLLQRRDIDKTYIDKHRRENGSIQNTNRLNFIVGKNGFIEKMNLLIKRERSFRYKRAPSQKMRHSVLKISSEKELKNL